MKRRKSNLVTNQKCQGYQPKMSIIPGCVVPEGSVPRWGAPLRPSHCLARPQSERPANGPLPLICRGRLYPSGTTQPSRLPSTPFPFSLIITTVVGDVVFCVAGQTEMRRGSSEVPSPVRKKRLIRDVRMHQRPICVPVQPKNADLHHTDPLCPIPQSSCPA